MRKTLLLAVVFCSVAFMGGCSTAPVKDIKVEAESAPGMDMNNYRTYAWLAAAKIVNDPNGRWEPPQFDADAEIKWLIDRELRARGISEVAAFPNVFVAFVAGVDMAQLELKQDPKEKMDVLRNVPKGALAVMLIDGASGDPVWAGAAVADIKTDRTPEETKARLDYAVTQMFRKLPKKQSAY